MKRGDTMELVKASLENSRELAAFLAKMNSIQSAHIGFCGEKAEEIHDQLRTDFSDLPLEKSFILAYEDRRLVGATGLDVDLEQGYAEVWGPFVEQEELETAQVMWNELVAAMPQEVKEFSFFINEENRFVKAFLANNNGVDQGGHTILELTSDSFASENSSKIDAYNENYEDSFKQLHDQVFPSTYYSGATILQRLNDANHLFIAAKNDHDIKGYVYVEANPDHGEASIEYIAVADEHRKEGMGKSLLISAVKTLFSYPQINQLTLSVSKENTAAIRLYVATGFKVKYNLISYDVVLTYV